VTGFIVVMVSVVCSSARRAVLFELPFLACYRDDTKHVHVPVGSVDVIAYFQDTVLSGCFAGYKV
jgi:hypothetical protein